MDADNNRKSNRKSEQMTTSQHLKLATIAALDANTPDNSITIVDAKTRAMIELPTLSVDVTSVAAHSEALQHVEAVNLSIVLRLHTGDEDEQNIDNWIDQIETILSDASYMKSIGDSLKVYSWVYQGSSQEWDENILEVEFTADALCSRFEAQN